MDEETLNKKAHELAVEFVGMSRREVTYEEAIDMLHAMSEFCTKRQTDKSIKVYPNSVTHTKAGKRRAKSKKRQADETELKN